MTFQSKKKKRERKELSTLREQKALIIHEKENISEDEKVRKVGQGDAQTLQLILWFGILTLGLVSG